MGQTHGQNISVETRRIVVLGKTGAGKSNLANVIFGETVFKVDDSPGSGTRTCETVSKPVCGKQITWIDTPGFFDTRDSEEVMKPEIMRCITECAPGPHAFLIVLKEEKFTKHEQEVIEKICQTFSEEAFKYAVVVFTHGDQLPEGTTIEEFVQKSKNLSNLVRKCGGRCHVFDNKYWNKPGGYRSNKFQVAELLKTIDKMIEQNKGGYYTNEILQKVEEKIQQEEERIQQSSEDMSREEIRQKAKANVSSFFASNYSRGALLVAFLGGAVTIGAAVLKAVAR